VHDADRVERDLFVGIRELEGVFRILNAQVAQPAVLDTAQGRSLVQRTRDRRGRSHDAQVLDPDLRNAARERIGGNGAARWTQELRIKGIGHRSIDEYLAAIDGRDGSIRENLASGGDPGLRQSVSDQLIHPHEGHPGRSDRSADENSVTDVESRRIAYTEAPRSGGDKVVRD
jgi:hypothetical protein